MATTSRRTAVERRHGRIRRTVSGTSDRPRLAVFRSNRGIYAQVIDDTAGRTLAAASSLDVSAANGSAPPPPAPEGGDEGGEGGTALTGKSAAAAAVGRLVAERAQAAGVTKVVFDRGGNRYHGRVKALADAARQGGLDF